MALTTVRWYWSSTKREANGMPCPECQYENPVGAKFCNECAAPLQLRCPSCNTANPQTAKFCHQCATPLVGPGPQGA
ncbi:hypothetical protein C2W62_32520 [Candidatus Entotheonella serta]|nr:hypothetical protein C2W62_32520 [Candidatus Entotheonella serta]